MKKFIRFVIILAIIGAGFYFGLPYLTDKMSKDTDKPIENETINSLEALGYNSNEIKIINDKLSDEEINELLDIEKDSDIVKFIEVDYFKFEKLNRYIAYNEKNNYTADKVVMYVNIGLDTDFYTNIKEVSNPYDKLAIVNKFNSLPKGFEAKNLVTFTTDYCLNGQKMEETAAENIMALIDDARSAGFTDLRIQSGYRTESLQNTLYTNSTNNNGKEHADKYSARPGHSEHQTGLAVDVTLDGSLEESFANEEVYTWLKDNAYKYGFIERYPKGKEFITGYGYEPWHYRYLGVDVAKIIYNEQITFEEYAVKYLNY